MSVWLENTVCAISSVGETPGDVIIHVIAREGASVFLADRTALEDTHARSCL
jgi:hypothetical protein